MTYQRGRESEEERALRLRREAGELARARRQVESGEVINGAELDALLDSLDQDVPLPPRKPRARN